MTRSFVRDLAVESRMVYNRASAGQRGRFQAGGATMIRHNLAEVDTCIARLYNETNSSAVLLVGTDGRLLAWRGQGMQTEAAEIGAAVARIVRRGVRYAISSERAPVYWYARPTWILVICDRRGLRASGARKLEAELQAVHELERLLPAHEGAIWAGGFRWSTP
jgi:hypothetical protein